MEPDEYAVKVQALVDDLNGIDLLASMGHPDGIEGFVLDIVERHGFSFHRGRVWLEGEPFMLLNLATLRRDRRNRWKAVWAESYVGAAFEQLK